MITPKVLGEHIKGKRHELGITQKELAEKINVTDKTISKWERVKGYVLHYLFKDEQFLGDMQIIYTADPEEEVLFDHHFTGRNSAQGEELIGALTKVEDIYYYNHPLFTKASNGYTPLIFYITFSADHNFSQMVVERINLPHEELYGPTVVYSTESSLFTEKQNDPTMKTKD